MSSTSENHDHLRTNRCAKPNISSSDSQPPLQNISHLCLLATMNPANAICQILVNSAISALAFTLMSLTHRHRKLSAYVTSFDRLESHYMGLGAPGRY